MFSTLTIVVGVVLVIAVVFLINSIFFSRPSPLGQVALGSAAGEPMGVASAPLAGDREAIFASTLERVDGYAVTRQFGVVTGHCIVGANVFRDMFAGITDFVGGRSRAYERSLTRAEDEASEAMLQRAQEAGGNAVIGVRIDYETIHLKGTMLMVMAVGTAVELRRRERATAQLSAAATARQQAEKPQTRFG